MIAFRVTGIPVPQGSMRAFVQNGRARVSPNNAGRLERWRGDIRSAAREVSPPTLLNSPVAVRLHFYAPRPASHYLPANRRREMRELRLDAPTWHSSPGDIDKLLRAVLDALTGVIYVDDAQVVLVRADKRYGDSPGVEVEIVDLSTWGTEAA